MRRITAGSDMHRYAKKCTSVFVVAFGLAFAGAHTGITAPLNGPPVVVDVATLKELHAALEKARPGSVVRLAAGIYQIYADDPYFLVKNIQGLPDQPIVIQGAASTEAGRRPTIIDGGRSLNPMLELQEHYRKPGSRPIELHDLLIQKQFRTERAVNCFVFENVAYLVIENLTVRNCLPTAFVIYGNSRYVTIRSSVLVGAMVPIFAGRYSDHLLVENNVWTQDPSGYTEDQSGYSGRVNLTPRPGRMWDTIPWGGRASWFPSLSQWRARWEPTDSRQHCYSPQYYPKCLQRRAPASQSLPAIRGMRRQRRNL
jgi:hypothetical protein